MARFDLSDAEWRIIAPLLPNKLRGAPCTDDRRVINAIFYVLRTGSPWRDLPERYGPHTTAYDRYDRWAKSGAWLRIFEALAERSPQSMALIDSSIIRAHQHAAGGKKGSGSRHQPFSWRIEHREIMLWSMVQACRSGSCSPRARHQTRRRPPSSSRTSPAPETSLPTVVMTLAPPSIWPPPAAPAPTSQPQNVLASRGRLAFMGRVLLTAGSCCHSSFSVLSE